ncbi:unnamed protein product [Mytilus coruscus]|uniref:IgGFc-binding protein N-terminal domain-containing protein n=1 Tax=Mytilus coruscus TaxID=42192 RepID=A0A6J8B6M4_MYTCO|nr:unnamed protein product [Mytilus coruscus]
MMIVPGIEHFSKEYVIARPKDLFPSNYITIIIKTSDEDGLRFVGNLLDVESPVMMARNESFTTVVKKMTGHSIYKIRHVSRNALYGVVVYGFGSSTAMDTLQDLGHKGKLFFTMFPIQLENRKNIFAQFIITTDRQTKVDFLFEYADINRTVVITTGVTYFDIPSSALMFRIGNKYTSIQSTSYCYRACEYHSDIVYESMIPADKWCRHFVIPPIHTASRFKIRTVSRNKNTTITIKTSRGYLYTRNGDPIEIDLSPESYFVSASLPILLSLYTLVETKGIIMMIVPGIEQFSKEYVIAPPKDPSYTNYITITIKTSDVDGLRLFGNLLDLESTVIKAQNESCKENDWSFSLQNTTCV